MTPNYLFGMDLTQMFDWNNQPDVYFGGGNTANYAPYISGSCEFRLKNKSTINHTADVYLKFWVYATIEYGPDDDLYLSMSYTSTGSYAMSETNNIITLGYIRDEDGLSTTKYLSLPNESSRNLSLTMTPVHGSWPDGSTMYKYHEGSVEIYLGQIEWPDRPIVIRPSGTFTITLHNSAPYGNPVNGTAIFRPDKNEVSECVYIPVVRPQEDYIALVNSHDIYIYGPTGSNPAVYDSYIFTEDNGWTPFSVRLFDN